MKTCIIILLLGISLTSNAQTTEELQLIRNHAEALHKSQLLIEQYRSPGGITGTLFYVYKAFVSSQDHISCSFTPSCSSYALTAIQTQGFIAGTLNTFDRLARCNGFHPAGLQVDPKSKRLMDPVRDIHYEIP